MAKLLTGSIDLSKIDKSKLYKSEKTGKTYLNVSIWVNDEVDQFGNIASVQQYMGKDGQKNYIGNLKEFNREEGKGLEVSAANNSDNDDLPF